MTKNQFNTRLFLSCGLYLIFATFFIMDGLYPAYIFSLIIAFPLSLYTQIEEGIFLINRKSIYLTLFYILYFFLVYFFYPVNLFYLSQIFTVVTFEELFFRFSFLGILRSDMDFIKFPLRTCILFIINSLFFLALHKQYTNFFEYLVVFFLSLHYCLIYYSSGIVPSIISHVLWNLYSPNIIFQVPYFVTNLILIILPVELEKRRERRERVPFLR
jgi:membrane protease YdiL (CAAX protease family)